MEEEFIEKNLRTEHGEWKTRDDKEELYRLFSRPQIISFIKSSGIKV